jgi:hypothetical protein
VVSFVPIPAKYGGKATVQVGHHISRFRAKGHGRSASGLRRRHLTTASADRGAAIPDLADPLGLLDGVAYPEKAAFYSTSMGSGTSCADGVRERHHL